MLTTLCASWVLTCSSVITHFHVPHQLSLLRALEIGPMGAAASSVLEVHSRGDPDLAMEKEWTILLLCLSS